jgi:hypothetical protein
VPTGTQVLPTAVATRALTDIQIQTGLAIPVIGSLPADMSFSSMALPSHGNRKGKMRLPYQPRERNIASSEAAKEAIWIGRLHHHDELVNLCSHQQNTASTSTPAPTTFADNLGAIQLILIPRFHERTKHIDIKYHHIRDVKLQYIQTSEMIADVLTKALSREFHWKHPCAMGLS